MKQRSKNWNNTDTSRYHTLQENTQHSNGHSDRQYYRRFSLTTFRRDTDETYNFMFVGISSENSDETPTKVRSLEISDKIPTEYYNFGVLIGFEVRRNSIEIFRQKSDGFLTFVGMSSEFSTTKQILDLQSYYKCIIWYLKYPNNTYINL